MKFVMRMLITAAGLFGVAYLSGGALLQVDEFWPAAVIAAVVLAVVNALIKPVVHFFAFPVTVLSLGLFSLVISALMLYIVAAVVPGVETTGFLQTVLASIIISIVSGVGNKLTESESGRG